MNRRDLLKTCGVGLFGVGMGVNSVFSTEIPTEKPKETPSQNISDEIYDDICKSMISYINCRMGGRDWGVLPCKQDEDWRNWNAVTYTKLHIVKANGYPPSLGNVLRFKNPCPNDGSKDYWIFTSHFYMLDDRIRSVLASLDVQKIATRLNPPLLELLYGYGFTGKLSCLTEETY